MNPSAAIAGFLCLGLTLGLICARAPLGERLGLIDAAGTGRKDHVGRTPTVGGLAIVAGLALAALILGFGKQIHAAFWLGLLMIVFTGTLDDMFDLNPYIKFAAQIAAALLMSYWGEMRLETLGSLVSDSPLTLGRYSLPLTMFAIIGVVNAINLCDGADGLAGGLAFIAVFWIAAFSLASGNAGRLDLTVGLLGCIAAFLAYNMRTPWRGRASIFLGDAGSLSLGFALAWLTMDAAQSRSQLFPPVVAIWLVAIPISDTIVCMTRRLVNGRSPFRADRTHLHHILIDLGLPVGTAVALIHVVAFALASIGVAGWVLGVKEHVMFYSAMGVFALYIVLVQAGLRRVAGTGNPA